jgi:hypothetical protein
MGWLILGDDAWVRRLVLAALVAFLAILSTGSPVTADASHLPRTSFAAPRLHGPLDRVALTGRAPRRTTVAQARRAARADAVRLVSSLTPPPDGTRVGRQPPGSGSLLRPVHRLVPGLAQAVAHAWWIVPERPRAVYESIYIDAPIGATVLPTAHEFDRTTGEKAEVLTYAWPAIPGVIDIRELKVTVSALRDGTTGVLAEAASVPVVPRPASERVPPATREIDVMKSDITDAGAAGAPIATYRLTGAELRVVVRSFDGLGIFQPTSPLMPIGCPPPPVGEDQLLTTLDFRSSAGGRVLAEATFTAVPGEGTTTGICNAIGFSIGGRQQPDLVGNFFGWLGHLLHTSFAAPEPPTSASELAFGR